MSDPTCYGSLQVCALRVAALQANGDPLEGADNGYVSDALISVDVGIELNDDVDLSKVNGCGNTCQSFFQQGTIKRATLGLALCELDLQLGQLLVGGDLARLDAGEGSPFGWSLPLQADAAPNGVCFEVWTKAWDGAEQATPTGLANAAAYWHWVFPKAKFQLDDMTMENDFLEFALTGFSTENSSIGGTGPFGDWGDDVDAFGGFTSAVGIFLDDTLPTADCDYIAVPATGS